MLDKAISVLSSYVDALRPIIYIRHFDFKVIDEIIRKISYNAKIIEYNNALGFVDFNDKHPMQDATLETFLKETREEGFLRETFLVLKDIHGELKSPKIISLLKRIAEDNVERESYHETIFIVSEELVIPAELEHFITIFDIPLPNVPEIKEIVQDYGKGMEIEISDEVADDLAISLKGLNEFQIRQILNLAYQDGGTIESDDKALIVKEKELLVKKDGMLEIVNFKEEIDDIGGLSNLKKWLRRKSTIFKDLDHAIKFGVDVPKGMLIVGMPGCGKSLTAKATANLFEIPLVRLDVGRLLGKYVGESENNMRKALNLAEAISPCVLWIDEIEKAFAGIGGTIGGNEVTTRLFGHFLTWMQEKENTVFIVATANNIDNMPPEFLRKGRFDELFFVDLPNGDERRAILKIHLKKRNKWNSKIDTIALIQATEGFSGVDLESAVKDAIEECFIKKLKDVSTENLLESIKRTKSITNTLGERIKKLKENIGKYNFINASEK
jgi:SpoVK/Ycf46/Vps4 family AAA+-type ATPase